MPAISGILYVGLTVTDARRSADWYARVLGMSVIKEIVLPDGWLYEVQLHDRASDTTIGLIHHRAGTLEPFNELRPGLDHVEFNVPTREELEAWVERLDSLGVPHSPVEDRPGARMVTFRDPDNIQLEFYWRKPKANQQTARP